MPSLASHVGDAAERAGELGEQVPNFFEALELGEQNGLQSPEEGLGQVLLFRKPPRVELHDHRPIGFRASLEFVLDVGQHRGLA